MIRIFALLAALLFAAPALAQSAPPTAEQVQTAKAHADAVIARNDAGAFFVNATTSEIPQVRHVPSGMICTFNPGDARDSISFYPAVPGGPPHGEDVSCASWWESTLVSMFATRYPQGYSADDLMVAAIGDIRRGWQNVVPLEGNVPVTTLTGQATPLIAAFNAEYQGQSRRTIVVLRNIDGWTFKARGSGEADIAQVAKASTLAFAVSIPGGWTIFEQGR
ncbi:MAG TPA: hypothetical protein VN018_06350 [Brevundimonas sp.]|nr:hypothetical protein [Brevundimonas sp.]